MDNNYVELLGIAEAMKVALRICKADHNEPGQCHGESISSATFYTDSTSALDLIDQFHLRPHAKQAKTVSWFEIGRIKQRTKELIKRGVRVSLKWAPGHCGIEGNERADLLAKQTSLTMHRRHNIEFEDMIPRVQSQQMPFFGGKTVIRFQKLFTRLEQEEKLQRQHTRKLRRRIPH